MKVPDAILGPLATVGAALFGLGVLRRSWKLAAAGAVAIVQGRDPTTAARDSLPSWSVPVASPNDCPSRKAHKT